MEQYEAQKCDLENQDLSKSTLSRVKINKNISRSTEISWHKEVENT
jgi:hypothetical protein